MEIETLRSATLETKLVDNVTYYTVIEWKNGEGFTISIEGKGRNVLVDLHIDDIEAINHLITGLSVDR